MSYSLVFFSSSSIALPLFKVLVEDPRFEIRALISQPDQAAGRHLTYQASEIKKMALEKNIPVYQPVRLKDDIGLLELFIANPPDFILSFAYGQLISQEWLDLSKIAPLNVHPSLLPKYRGPSPLQGPILKGDKETGISLIKMVPALDAGPIAAQKIIPLGEHETASLLFEQVAQISAKWIPNELVNLATSPSFRDQNDSDASFTEKLSREDGELNFNQSAEILFRQFKAFQPWPGVATSYEGKRLKILDMELSSEVLEPGKVKCAKNGFFLGSSDGSLFIKQIQPEGKSSMHADAFTRGHSEFCSASLPS